METEVGQAKEARRTWLPTMIRSRVVSAGKLERVARGVYSLPGRTLSEHRSLAGAALRLPRGYDETDAMGRVPEEEPAGSAGPRQSG